MKRTGKHVARVSVGATNRSPGVLLDCARRQADYLGFYGFKAKRGQSDDRLRRRGYLRLVFPTRALAVRYKNRVTRLGEPALRCRLM